VGFVCSGRSRPTFNATGVMARAAILNAGNHPSAFGIYEETGGSRLHHDWTAAPQLGLGPPMLIILNSDILNSESLLTTLTPPVQRLVDACHVRGHVIVVPETTKLEFDRKQNDLVSTARIELDSAYSTLTRYGVNYEHRLPEDVVSPPDLMGLIAKSGAIVQLAEPTIDDFREAHRRASLHLVPHPQGNTKSDEMRDLVIWMIAIRLAKENSGALLISRDAVHVHNRGDSEANEAGLMRVKNVDEALEFLDVQTPAGQLLRQLMEPAWALLANEGLPLAGNPRIRSVTRSVFEQGDSGLASASAVIKVETTTGQILQGRVDVDILADHQEVTLRNIVADSGSYPQSISVQTATVLETEEESEKRISQLREILEGEP
jgi:hypothetical protein